MITQKNLVISFLLLFPFQSVYAISFADQLKDVGYVEFCNNHHGVVAFDSLYQKFDLFIEFLQKNPAWVHKLYAAKERFIRSKNRNYYSTDIFGFYDESEKIGRHQISFYYSTLFHEFICSSYKEFNQVPEIIQFFQACCNIQQPYGNVFDEVAVEVGIANIFNDGHPPILLKIVKYFPNYSPCEPHYDGSVFTLFLDSTNNQALLLSPYKSSLLVDDFVVPIRKFTRLDYQNSMMLIPGTLVTEFFIYPTPHIVLASEDTRYATIAFAMRPNYVQQKIEFSSLPNFKD